VLLALAGWFAFSAALTLPHMSTGTLWTNLPMSLASGVWRALPWALLGVWMSVLGRRRWWPDAGLRSVLLLTYAILLVVGALAIAAGIHAVNAAEISTSRGGGLLSPLAWIPLLFGLPVVVLAAFSLPVPLLALPASRSDGQHPADTPYLTGVPGRKPLMQLLVVWLLLACGVVVVVPIIWPRSEADKLAGQEAAERARRQSDAVAVRERAGKPSCSPTSVRMTGTRQKPPVLH
jgi:hypothetical protein